MQIDTHLLPPRATEEGTSILQGREHRNLQMHTPGEEQWNRADLFGDDNMALFFSATAMQIIQRWSHPEMAWLLEICSLPRKSCQLK